MILAGGAARRLGGVDKPGLVVGDRTLLERVAAAVPAAGRIIVVGPPRERPAARYVREDPPGGGPVPALRRGVAEVAAPWLVLLAGDLPFVEPRHVTMLRLAADGHDGALLLDAEGHPQWLAGVWRTDVLRAALGGYTGASLRGLLAPLRHTTLAAEDPVDAAVAVFDCDTPEDLARARAVEDDPP